MAITITRIAPPSKPTGVTVTAVHGLDKVYSEESSSLVDRTSEFTTGAGVQFMTSDDDYLYVGLDTKRYTQSSTAIDGRWANLYISLTTPANVDLGLTFEYSNASGGWSSLSVTDGTNGFTQDGTISFNIASYPSFSQWKPIAVEDATKRFYIRIKRTTATVATPPTINEMGTGILIANTIYYYKVFGMVVTGASSGYPLRSVPSDEASGTTTTIKRSLKVEWANSVSTEKYYIMRTPTSEDYKISTVNTGIYTSASEIDNEAQSVNCGYFIYYDIETESRDYTTDIGIPLFARSNTATTIISSYVSFAYFDKARGSITVSGGTELTPAKFEDIYDADQLNGWDTFLMGHIKWANYNIWTCYDHIAIEDYFADSFVTLYTSGFFTTLNCTSTVFGELESTGTTLGGIRLIYANSAVNSPPLRFKNTIFYNSMINDDSRNDRSISRNYTGLYFYDDCEIYDSAIQNELKIDVMKFEGENIISDNLRIVNSRYGFEILDTSIDTATITDLQIYGEYGLSTRSWADGLSIAYRDFEMIDNAKVIWNWPGSEYVVGYSTTFNLIDFTFTNSDIMDSDLALESSINIYDSLALLVTDSGGVALSSTSVVIKDVNGDEISGSPFTTDINGKINPDILKSVYTTSGDTPGVSSNTYAVDQEACYHPYTIIIERDSYQTYTSIFTHSANEEWNIALQKKEYYQQAISGTVTVSAINGKVSEDNISATVESSAVSGSIKADSISANVSELNIDGTID